MFPLCSPARDFGHCRTLQAETLKLPDLVVLLVGFLASVSVPAAALGAGVLCGTVRDAQTTQPVPSAGVFLYQSNAYTGLYGATGVDGAFCIDEVPAGIYDVQVRVDDYETAWVAGVEVSDVTTSVDISSGVPMSLQAPWPNPAGSVVHFGFASGVSAPVELAVFDVRGRRLHTWTGHPEPGSLTVPWGFVDQTGREVPSGVYFVRLRIGDRQLTRSFVRIR